MGNVVVNVNGPDLESKFPEHLRMENMKKWNRAKWKPHLAAQWSVQSGTYSVWRKELEKPMRFPVTPTQAHPGDFTANRKSADWMRPLVQLQTELPVEPPNWQNISVDHWTVTEDSIISFLWSIRIPQILEDFEKENAEVAMSFCVVPSRMSVRTEDNLNYINSLLLSDTFCTSSIRNIRGKESCTTQHTSVSNMICTNKPMIWPWDSPYLSL